MLKLIADLNTNILMDLPGLLELLKPANIVDDGVPRVSDLTHTVWIAFVLILVRFTCDRTILPALKAFFRQYGREDKAGAPAAVTASHVSCAMCTVPCTYHARSPAWHVKLQECPYPLHDTAHQHHHAVDHSGVMALCYTGTVPGCYYPPAAGFFDNLYIVVWSVGTELWAIYITLHLNGDCKPWSTDTCLTGWPDHALNTVQRW